MYTFINEDITILSNGRLHTFAVTLSKAIVSLQSAHKVSDLRKFPKHAIIKLLLGFHFLRNSDIKCCRNQNHRYSKFHQSSLCMIMGNHVCRWCSPKSPAIGSWASFLPGSSPSLSWPRSGPSRNPPLSFTSSACSTGVLCIVDHCTITGTNVWHTVFIEIFVIYIYNYIYTYNVKRKQCRQ